VKRGARHEKREQQERETRIEKTPDYNTSLRIPVGALSPATCIKPKHIVPWFLLYGLVHEAFERIRHRDLAKTLGHAITRSTRWMDVAAGGLLPLPPRRGLRSSDVILRWRAAIATVDFVSP